MKNLTPELIAKAKEANTPEELLALAKENGIDLTEDEAKTYFAQLNTDGSVSDDDLDGVSGGGFFGCPDNEEEEEKEEDILYTVCPHCIRRIVKTSKVCPLCGARINTQGF